MDSSFYYQAHIDRQQCWFFVAILRSFEHLVFDRTLNKQESLFEFFVTPLMKDFFERLMVEFQSQGVVLDWSEQPNRLLIAGEAV